MNPIRCMREIPLIDSLLGDGVVTPRAARDGAANQTQHGREGVLAAMPATRIRNLGEEAKQSTRRSRLHAMTLTRKDIPATRCPPISSKPDLSMALG